MAESKLQVQSVDAITVCHNIRGCAQYKDSIDGLFKDYPDERRETGHACIHRISHWVVYLAVQMPVRRQMSGTKASVVSQVGAAMA